MINDHHQLRWLADGVNRMALGCVMNSMWDCWAKIDKKPQHMSHHDLRRRRCVVWPTKLW